MTSYTKYINKSAASSSDFSNHSMARGKNHKRVAPELSPGDGSDSYHHTSEGSHKRQRNENLFFFQRSNPNLTFPPTPPDSAASLLPQLSLAPPPRLVRPGRLLHLKLAIPKREPDPRERRQLAARKAAATKWVPKLQNPFPTVGEINKAYNLKLLRHYPAETAPENTTTASNYPPSSSRPPMVPCGNADIIKPVIAKSARVANLLKAFPALEIPATSPHNGDEPLDLVEEEAKLMCNRRITATGTAEKLAWQSFAEPVWSKREVMVESALPQGDLQKEAIGLPNRLPEWKKWRTGKYCVKEQDARVRGKGKARRL